MRKAGQSAGQGQGHFLHATNNQMPGPERTGLWVGWMNIDCEADGECMLQSLWSVISLLNRHAWTRSNYHLHLCGYATGVYRKDANFLLRLLHPEASFTVDFRDTRETPQAYINRTLCQHPVAQTALFLLVHPLIVFFPDAGGIEDMHLSLLCSPDFALGLVVPQVSGLTLDGCYLPGPLHFCPLIMCRMILAAPWPAETGPMVEGHTKALQHFVLLNHQLEVCSRAVVHVDAGYQHLMGEEPYMRRQLLEHRILAWLDSC